MQSHLSRLASRLTAAAAMLAVATITQAAEKRVIYVDKSAPPGGDGTSWQKAFQDLGVALRSIEDYRGGNNEVRVAGGTYTPDVMNGDRERSFSTPITSSAANLSILGSFAGFGAPDPDQRDYVATRTVLSGDLNNDDGPKFTNRGDNAAIVARFWTNGRLVVDGLTVRGASADPPVSWAYGISAGAGSDIFGRWTGSVLMTNCTIEDNDTKQSVAGAGVYGAVVEVADCTFRGNRNRDSLGGGLTVASSDGQRALVQRCVFENNEANYGGGAYVELARLERCVFVGNKATFQGGGYFGTGSVLSSLFVGNQAGSSGGAIAGRPGMIASCSIVANGAPTASAISTFNASPWILNNIIWGNESSSDKLSVQLLQCLWSAIFHGNLIEGGLASTEFSGAPTWIERTSESDPRFIRAAGEPQTTSDWRTWNYRLRPDSPAIGAGTPRFYLPVALDGSVFYSGSDPRSPDAGCYFITRSDCFADLDRSWPFLVDDSDFQLFAAAYELTIAPPANPLADLNNDGLVDDSDFSLFAVAYDALICP
jgi:hypothetical protein